MRQGNELQQYADIVQCPGRGRVAEQGQLQRKLAPACLDVRVDAFRVVAEEAPHRWRRGRGHAPAVGRQTEYAHAHVRLQPLLTEQFRQPTPGKHAEELHLKQSILGCDKALAAKHVATVAGCDVRDTLCVTGDHDGGVEDGQRDVALRLIVVGLIEPPCAGKQCANPKAILASDKSARGRRISGSPQSPIIPPCV